MPFDSRWPDAATIAYLIERGLPLQTHCNKCGRARNFDPTTLPLAPETIVPALEGRFRCTRCGSRETSARPDYSVERERIRSHAWPT